MYIHAYTSMLFMGGGFLQLLPPSIYHTWSMIYLVIYRFIYQLVHRFIYLSVYLSLSLYIYIYIYLSSYISIYSGGGGFLQLLPQFRALRGPLLGQLRLCRSTIRYTYIYIYIYIHMFMIIILFTGDFKWIVSGIF